MASIPASTPASTLRATVQADAASGVAATVLVDGADTTVTANGLTSYTPATGDRVLVQKVGGQVEILQFVSRANTDDLFRATVQITGTAPGQTATVLIDGQITNVTATGLPGYTPKAGDIVLLGITGGVYQIKTTATPQTQRAVVQASATSAGASASVLVDGTTSNVTAAGLSGYIPHVGDVVLVQVVAGILTIMQFTAAQTFAGTVTNTGTAPAQNCVVTLDATGGSITALGVTGYVPVSGDRVLVEQVSGTWVVSQITAASAIIGQIIATAPTGPRVVIEVSGNTGYGQLAFYTSNPYEDPTFPPGLYASVDNLDAPYSDRVFLIGSGVVGHSSNAPYVSVVTGWDPSTSTLSQFLDLNAGSSVGGTPVPGTIRATGNLALDGNLDPVSTSQFKFSHATTGTTTASGQLVVTHGLGYTPNLVLANNQGAGGSSHLVIITGVNSTQFTATVRNVAAAGATVNSTAVDLRWVPFSV